MLKATCQHQRHRRKSYKNPETPKNCFAVSEKHANAEKIKQKKLSCNTKSRKFHLLLFVLVRPVY